MPEDQRIAETIANWLAEQAGAEIAFEKRSSRETSRFCPTVNSASWTACRRG